MRWIVGEHELGRRYHWYKRGFKSSRQVSWVPPIQTSPRICFADASQAHPQPASQQKQHWGNISALKILHSYVSTDVVIIVKNSALIQSYKILMSKWHPIRVLEIWLATDQSWHPGAVRATLKRMKDAGFSDRWHRPP